MTNKMRCQREAYHMDGRPTNGERLTNMHQQCMETPFSRLVEANQKSAQSRARNKAEREDRLALRRF